MWVWATPNFFVLIGRSDHCLLSITGDIFYFLIYIFNFSLSVFSPITINCFKILLIGSIIMGFCLLNAISSV